MSHANNPAAPALKLHDPADAADPIAAFDPLTFFHGPVDEFNDRLAAFVARLGVRDALDDGLIARVVFAMRMLRRAAETLDQVPPGDMGWCRLQDRASRELDRALTRLHKERAERERADRAAEAEAVARAQAEAEAAAAEAAARRAEPQTYMPGTWRERIVLDRSHSPRWPIVKGTTVEVDAVIVDLRDGLTPEAVLAERLELCMADILACLECELAGLAGPFDQDDRSHGLDAR